MTRRPTSSKPEGGLRRVLMCVSGTSPAVVTETLYALITQEPPFVPDEIHVVTTLRGRKDVLEKLLDPVDSPFSRLVRDYVPGRQIRFDADTVHVIAEVRKVPARPDPFSQLIGSQPPRDETVELADITTAEENRAAADTIYRVMREIKAVPDTVLHASVAGGRKSMSFYMGHAFSLLAGPQDVLSHVLVNAPFETVKDFFYPPPVAADLCYRDAGEERSIRTDRAKVSLAELSVLRLGPVLGQDWPDKAKTSFSFAVQLAQAALEVPELRVVLDVAKARGHLELCDETVPLAPLQFTVFALHALALKYAVDWPGGAALKLEDLPSTLWEALAEDFRGGRFKAPARDKGFGDVRSKIQVALREAVGPAAHHFRIAADSGIKKQGGHSRPVCLAVPADRIILVGLEDWRRQLKKALLPRGPNREI
jgi:CRISPR-associated protein (TIGR02584 family)